MKKTLLIIILLFISGFLYTQEDKIKLAVSPFDDSITAVGESEKIGNIISLQLEEKLSGTSGFQVRKTNAIRNYLRDLINAQLGIINTDKMKGNPALLKIDYLTVGSVARINRRYEIDSRTVDINTWEIIHSKGINTGSIPAAIDKIVKQMSRGINRVLIDERKDNKVNKPVLSVFNFKDFNELAGKRGYGGTFAEIMNSELGSKKQLSVIERKYSKSLIKEKVLEMAGVIGNDDSNNIFKIKGIQYKLAGDIRVFKDLICLNFRLHSTSDGRVVYSESRELSTFRYIRPISRIIAKNIEDALNNRIGTLSLRSNPAGADVFVDEQAAGKTPLVLSLSRGEHTIKVKLEGYKTHISRVAIKPMKINKLVFNLRKVELLKLQKAYSLENRGKWQDAIKAYRNFIDEYPDSSFADNAYYRKGHIEMLQLKNYKTALNTFQDLVNRYPDVMTRAEAYYGMAQVYYKMGDKTNAKIILQYLLDKYGETYAAEEAKKLKWNF